MLANRAMNALIVAAIVVCCAGCSSDTSNRPAHGTSGVAAESEEQENCCVNEFVGATSVGINPDGTVSRVEGKDLALALKKNASYQESLRSGDYSRGALQFIQEHRSLFRLDDPGSELEAVKSQRDQLGFHQVRLAQFFNGIPVLNTEILIQFDAEDNLNLVQAKYIQTPSAIDRVPSLKVEEVIDRLPGHGKLMPIGPNSGLSILPKPAGTPVLVYRLSSTISLTDQSTLFVDANNGKVLGRVPTTYQ